MSSSSPLTDLGRKPPRFAHVAFGLPLLSELQFPNLPTLEQPITTDPVEIQLRQQDDFRCYIPADLLSQPTGFHVTSQAAVVYLKNIGVFQIKDGTQVTIIPVPEAPPDQLRQAVTGIVMALLLHQRGQLVLHGSAVSIAGQAVVFLGDSGEGKSSMAAVLYAQGHDLLTDDLAAIELVAPPRVAIAGTPIKLHPQVAQTLELPTPKQSLPTGKHLYSIEPPPAGPQPLDRIFVLETAPEITLTPLPLQQSVTTLMRFAGLKAILPSRDATHFTQCATLAQHCPIYSYRRPKDLEWLPEIAAQLVRDLTYDRANSSSSRSPLSKP